MKDCREKAEPLNTACDSIEWSGHHDSLLGSGQPTVDQRKADCSTDRAKRKGQNSNQKLAGSDQHMLVIHVQG